MRLQQEKFLVSGQQEAANRHGKLRTKFDRLLLPMHLLHCLCTHLERERTQTEQFDLEGAERGLESDTVHSSKLELLQC